MGLIVVCDTNVFVRETHLLRKKGGPELVRHLRASDGRLFVPEILRTEYIEQIQETTTPERQRYEAVSSFFSTLIGFQHQPLPTDEAIVKSAIDRLRMLESITLAAELDGGILEAAGRRSMAKRRPTSKTDHGYKDCLIWETVLRLPAGSDVRFVTHDKAFYKGDCLAQDLIDEAKAKEIRVKGYKDIEELVRDLQVENPDLYHAAIEAQDFVEKHIAAPEDIATSTAPILVAPDAAQPESAVAVVADGLEGVSRRLAEAHTRFEQLELKVLAYIAYLDSARRDQLFELLEQSAIPADTTRNVVERLIMDGFVRDTGNHYLVTDRTMAEIVAPTVENEIIELLAKDSGGHGR